MISLDLTGKIAVVTGAFGQLGLQFSRALNGAGARVAMLDIKLDDKVIEAFENDRFMAIKADVTSRSSLESALKKIVNKWGLPDILINNAAIDSTLNAPAEENGPFEEYPLKSWRKMMEINLTGPLLCSQVFGGMMNIKNKQGSIINIGSIYGSVSPRQELYQHITKDGKPFVKAVSYAVSKSGLAGLTRYLATYWRGKIRVNLVTLGGVFRNQDKLFIKKYAKNVPIGRMAREDEYNSMIVYLSSNEASYVNGANLVLDGGWTAW